MSLRHCVLVIGLLLSGVAATSAYAHKVNVFAYAEGDEVYIQGYFSDGTKAKNSDVTVFTRDGSEFAKGKTNENGEYAFATKGDRQALRIVLNAGLGHQAAYEIPVDELAGDAATQTAEVADVKDPLSGPGNDPVNAGNDAAAAPMTEAMVRKAVAEGVLPLAREISALKERRGFSDIVGGIGLILGILGIFAYVRARQEARRATGASVDKGQG